MRELISNDIISQIRRGGQKNLSYVCCAIFLALMVLPSFAADWKDAEGNEYNALKYLKGNGAAYIITDITPSCTDIVKMKFKLGADAAGALFCARDGSANGSFTCYHDYSASQNKIRLDRGLNKTFNQKKSTSLSKEQDFLLTADYGRKNATIVQDGSSDDLFGSNPLGGDDIYTVGSSLVFFAMHKNLSISGSYGSDYIYYFELYDSDAKLKNCLLPAERNDGVLGFYDTKTGKFYAQQGDAFDYAARTVSVTDTCKKWIGRGENNNMSTSANWEGDVLPCAGDNLDFTLAPPLAEINADMPEVTFGKLWIDDGDLPAFTGSLTATGINDLARMRAYDTATEGFTFELAAPSGQDFIWSGGAAANNWKATDVWTYNDTTSSWFDNNNAIFNTDNAMVALEGNVSANSLVFKANATISGSDPLTVPLVTVDPDVSATISAPTAGTLEKTGEGSLTLSQNRSDATVLSDGTLALTGEASLDWSKFTFGTDSAKPVMLEFGPTASFSDIPSDTWKIGNEPNITTTIVKKGGDWTPSKNIVIGNADGASTTFINEDGNFLSSDYFRIGDKGSATLVVSGGTVGSSSSSSSRVFVGYTGEGTLVVTNGGVFSANKSLYVARSANGTINVSDGGQVHTGTDIIFNYNNAAGRGVINLGSNGVIEAGRVYSYHSGGSAIFNFDGGIFKSCKAGDSFAANDITVTVSENGGTLDNNSLSVGLPCTIMGAGGMTLSGSGTTTISADQSYFGTTTVSNGTTLSVSGGVTFAGPVAFNEDSAFDIASATPGVASITAATLTLPATGTVPLTFAGGAFAEGIYTICSATGLTDADGEKFAPSTGELGYSWDMVNSALVLTVGNVDSNAWTGRGGDGRMSTPSNWAGSSVPEAGADIDLSGISADTTIIADAGRTFGAVKMGAGVITFTNSFAATSFSDTSKIAVDADSTVTVEGDLVFATNETCYICHSVATGGTFAVTGNIIAMAGQTGTLVPCYETVNEGVIASRGLVNNAKSDDHFALARAMQNALVKWRIGEDGLSGTNRFFMGSRSGVHAMIIASTNFTISSGLVAYRHLTLDTAGYEITLGTNTLSKSGGIFGSSTDGLTTVTGSGKVVVSYNVNHLSEIQSSRTNAFTVAQGGTLAFKDGGNIGTGALTIQGGGTLEIMESATVTHNGTLQLEDGAALAFNFTSRTIEPQFALAEGESLIFSEGGSTNILVKITGDVWPVSGEKLLTTCGNFDADGVNVSLAEGAPKWVQGVSVEEGNIVLRVKPMPMSVIVR